MSQKRSLLYDTLYVPNSVHVDRGITEWLAGAEFRRIQVKDVIDLYMKVSISR